jgi:type 2 lantibiotic biosynthesis protein LanM
MSNGGFGDTVYPVTPTPAAQQPTTWWAGGLRLVERPPAPGGRTSSRLARWRAAHGTEERFTERLSDAGLDEDALDALLAEPARELAARTGRPEWAAFVERATANAARATFAGGTWSAAFAHVLRPLAVAAGDDPRLDGAFTEQLTGRLVRIAARTLVLELNLARQRGDLVGDTPEDRFTHFVNHVDLAGLLRRYPVLARLLAQTCLHGARAHVEMLDRFATDRERIVAELLDGVDPGAIIAVESGQGDSHGRGRTVCTLRFADGSRLVYKPRTVDLHVRFNEMLAWLDGHTRLGLRRVRIVRGEGYGWAEFVEHEECSEVSGIGRFYHRLGAVLALVYAVDGTDMHYENLIACGDQPVLIDIETLFHPTLLTSAPSTDPAANALANSVTRTALLPQMLLGDHGVFDLSGLGGDRDRTYPSEAVGWADPATDTMRLVRRPAPSTGAHNRPRLGGEEAEPGDYQTALLAGFRVGHDTICAHRAELLELLRRCADVPVRFVARATRGYSTALDETTHPSVARDALDRDLALDLLWTEAREDALLRALVPHELADLWAGDVPLFTVRPGSRDVWTSTGERIPDLLPVSGLDAACRKVARMDEVDRHDQQWLIAASLASRSGLVVHRGADALPDQVTAGVPDPARLLAAACGIADEVLAHATVTGDRVNWLGLELVDDRHWTVMPMGAGLSNGYTGVALFLAQLGALTGAERYTEFARDALRPIPVLLDALAADPALAPAVGSGGFHGLGGISYALARLTTIMPDDPDLPRWLEASVDLAWDLEDESSSVVDGAAGGLAAMVAVHAETGLPQAGKLAHRFADRLADRPADGDGFARGAAGVGWALLRYAVASGEVRHAVSGRAALRADRSLRQRLLPVGEADHGWCSGLSGAVLAHVAHPEQPLDAYTLHLDRCINALAVHEPLRDLSLCHGELGVVEALTVLAERGHDRAAAARTRRAGLVLGSLEQYGARCGTPGGVPSAGLLTGLSGIGYGLLRLGFAEHVPSVLLLQPS